MLTREQAVKKLANKLIAMMDGANCYLVKDYQEIRALEATALRSLDGVCVPRKLLEAIDARLSIGQKMGDPLLSSHLRAAMLAASPNATQAPTAESRLREVAERVRGDCLEECDEGSATDDISDAYHRGYMAGIRGCRARIRALDLDAIIKE